MITYVFRAVGVVLMILSPLVFKVVGPRPALVFMSIGFGLLIPDLIDDLDMFRGDD